MKSPFFILFFVFGLLGALFLSACSEREETPSTAIAAEIPVNPPIKEEMAVLSEPISGQVVAPSAASVSTNSKQLVIADFNQGEKPNNLGGDFGAWNKDPDDDTQGCYIAFEAEDATGDSAGYSLKIDYDVDSENPAYNGFWMKLNGLNASAYDTVSFYLRGDGLNNYTKRIKVELKDMSNRPSPYIINGITESWQKFSIPFERFRKIQDWSAMSEFVVVFDDMNSDPKQGTILIDHVVFEKK